MFHLRIASYFPYLLSINDIDILSVTVKRIKESEILRFLDFIDGTQLTYDGLYHNFMGAAFGHSGVVPSVNISYILPMLKPPSNFTTTKVQQFTCVSDIQDFITRTQTEISDTLQAGAGNAAIATIRKRLMCTTVLPEKHKADDVVAPVHGPYKESDYDDESFARSYDMRQHEQRVHDVSIILANVTGHIVALGDGAGICIEAVSRIQRSDLTVTSYDGSKAMVALAKNRGYNVELAKFCDVVVSPTDIVFLSHVVDYDDTLIKRFCNQKLIVYERNKIYKDCWLLRPYYKDRGWVVATANIELGGLYLISECAQTLDIDYSVFGIVADPNISHLEIRGDLDPHYHVLVDEYNRFLSHRQNAYLTGYISSSFSNTLRVAVPGLGVIDNVAKLNISTLLTAVQTCFLSVGTPLVRPCCVYRRFIFSDQAIVYALNGGARIPLSTRSGVGDTKICNVHRRFSNILLVNCGCCDTERHDHYLSVVGKYAAILGNCYFALKCRGLSPTQANLIEYFVAWSRFSPSIACAVFGLIQSRIRAEQHAWLASI